MQWVANIWGFHHMVISWMWRFTILWVHMKGAHWWGHAKEQFTGSSDRDTRQLTCRW